MLTPAIMRVFIFTAILFFTPFFSYAAETYTLNVPTVGLTASLDTTGDISCSGVGGWSKNPVYSYTTYNVITAENTYKFTSGNNAYPTYASATAAFGSGVQYIFHCANPTKIVWFDRFGLVVGDSIVQLSPDTAEPLLNDFQTRFITATNIGFSSSTDTLSFDVSQYIDTTELITSVPNRNISLHYVQYVNGTSTTDLSAQGFSFTPSNGYSTTSISLTDSEFQNLYTGTSTFTVKVNFGNLTTGLNTGAAFPATYLYFLVTLNNGNFVTATVDAAANYQNAYEAPLPCSLTDLGGCFVNVTRYLFVPSAGSLAALTSIVSSSSIPFVANAYTYYEVTRDALATGQNATSTLTYTFEVSQASISVPMLSAATITGGLGDAAPMFRAIGLVVLVFGFLAMILSTISSHIGVQIQPQGDIINKRSGIRGD